MEAECSIFFRSAHLDMRPLIETLPFIKNKTSWGAVFRYGFFEIDIASFYIIAQGMFNYLSVLNLTAHTY